MITNSILKFFGVLIQPIVNMLPSFTFIDGLINVKEQFINFIEGYLKYLLYFFNVPVITLCITLLVSYIGFLAVEYIIKLCLKYFTNVI